jgi:hypothetical protein
LGLEAQNHAAEIKLRAQRRAGEILAEMDMNRGGQAEQKSYRSQAVTGRTPTLEEMGIGKMDSSRWQQVAALPQEVFGHGMTQMGVLCTTDPGN